MERCNALVRGRPKAHAHRLRLVLVLAGVMFLFAYGAPALIAQDPLWFVNRFDRQPVQIVVHHHPNV